MDRIIIKCDRCGRRIAEEDWFPAGGDAGRCDKCGENLCGNCAGDWDDYVCEQCAERLREEQEEDLFESIASALEPMRTV